MKNKKIIHISYFVLLFVLINCILIVASMLYVAIPQKYTIADSTAIVASKQNDNVMFVKNQDENLLKASGYIGTILNNETKLTKDVFMLSAENNLLTTNNLTLDKVDYTGLEEEIEAFASNVVDVKKIENFCTSLIFVNYKKHNRAKIDMKVTKTFVDGSEGLAPYAGVWDIKTSILVTTIKVGLDKHNVEAMLPSFAKSEDMIDISNIETNFQNKTVSITNTLQNTFKIEAGIKYDNIIPNMQVGSSYEFTYGKSLTYSFVQGSFSQTLVSHAYENVFGIKMEGSRYLVKPNDKNPQTLDFNMVQRLGYFDADDIPDDLFAFAGIRGIKIKGQVFAPSIKIGIFDDQDTGTDTVCGILLGWKSDNSAHSYMANCNGYENLINESSNSNLPEDIWDFFYGYGY